MEEGSVDAATGQKAPQKVGKKRKRSESHYVDGESRDLSDELMNTKEKSPKRKVKCIINHSLASHTPNLVACETT